MKQFPFSAILGQDKMKKALLWNVINPKIGGALLCGEKGTAKSTLVRALAAMLEDTKVVELPLNVTEDRLVGSIDLKAAIQDGVRRFEPGILHSADGNLLYIDEVNLLSDHIINSMLEVAASGTNRVEREGVTYSHPARFIMIGSMNPEEGKLRPQFLDRFGLYVDVTGSGSVAERAEIIRRRLIYEKDSANFNIEWAEELENTRKRIRNAKQLLSDITVTDNAMTLAATLSAQANCAGQRAELVIIETARAIAVLDGRITLNMEDIREAAEYALPHRLRNAPPEMPPPPENPPAGDEIPPDEREPEELSQQPSESDESPEPPESSETEENESAPPPEQQENPETPPETDAPDDDVQEVGDPFIVRPWLNDAATRTIRLGSGRRSLVKTSTTQGRYVLSAFPHGNRIQDIAFDATLRAAAVYQPVREKNGVALAVRAEDIRIKKRERRTGNTILFVVDASGSMGANRRMTAVKGAICSLLNDAYQKRDKVGMIAFRKRSAELLLNITRSVELAQKRLAELPTGGRTPIGEGLSLAREVLRVAKIRDKDILPVLVLVSDGRANASLTSPRPVEQAIEYARAIAQDGIKAIIIDTERDYIRLKLAEKLADAMRADYFRIEDLNADMLTKIVSASVERI